VKRLARVAAAAASLGACALVARTSRADPPGRGRHADAPPQQTTSAKPADTAPADAQQADAPDEDDVDPAHITGVERPAVERGDSGRAAGANVLFPFRELFAGLFAGADALASIAAGLKIVPRVEQLIFPEPGEIALVPTIFFQSKHAPNFGGRILERGDAGEAVVSAAGGGAHDVYVATDLVWKRRGRLPWEISVDTLFDERDDLEFFGLGQDPDTDPRNHYRSTATTHDALYLEKRSRVVAAADVSILPWLHVVGSGSLFQSRVRDASDAGLAGFEKVFVPTPYLADAAQTRIAYGEVALRASSRRQWDGAEPGAKAEFYGGYGANVGGADARYAAIGGRAVLSIPILRPTNTLSPQLVLDAVDPIGPDAAFPFTALTRQPDYRGYDVRRDNLSLVASLDYRWVIHRYVAMRVFTDFAEVAPRVDRLLALPPRFAAGFGFDLFNHETALAQFSMSFSEDGPRVAVTFGWAPLGGDRQHRN
jgi:hypothetical protein